MTPKAVRVVGVGNELRGDDAVGLRVVRRLREAVPAADVVERDGEPTGLLDALSGTDDVIVVDAVSSGAPLGRVHRLDVTDEPLRVGSVRSSHGFGLAATIELGRALGLLPARLRVYGIEAGTYGLGAPLDADVEGAADALVDELRAMLA